jgi:hypothetical protein
LIDNLILFKPNLSISAPLNELRKNQISYELSKNKYPSTNGIPLSKQCALIAVDEILDLYLEESRNTRYWEDVKEEIENLTTK